MSAYFFIVADVCNLSAAAQNRQVAVMRFQNLENIMRTAIKDGGKKPRAQSK